MTVLAGWRARRKASRPVVALLDDGDITPSEALALARLTEREQLRAATLIARGAGTASAMRRASRGWN